MNRKFAFGLLLALPQLVAPILHGQSPYVPKQADPLEDIWRWQVVEALGSHNLRITFNEAGEALVLKNIDEDRVLFFDGIQTKFLPRPSTVNGRPYRLFFDAGGSINLFADNGVYLYRNDAWELLAAHSFRLNDHSEFATSDDGRYWLSGTHGVVEFDGERVFQHPFNKVTVSGVQSLCFGNDGALYLVAGPSGDVYRCPFSDGHLTPQSEWRRIYESKREFVHQSWMLGSGDGKIWMVNNHEHDGAMVYDIGTQTWETHDLRSFGGENFSTTIMESRDGHVWVAGRGSLQVFDGRNWQIYKGPEYPIPDGWPFLAENKDGFVHVIERGGGVRRIDYAQKNFRTLSGLHFQAEGNDGNYWYLDVDGNVVLEQRRSGAGWLKYSREETGLKDPVALVVLDNGHILCAGSDAEAAAFSIYDGQLWKRYRYPEFAPGLSHQGIIKLRNGDVILSCGQPDSEYPNIQGGMLRVSYQNDTYVVTHHDPEEVTFRPWTVAEDPESGALWTGGDFLSEINFGTPALKVDSLHENIWIDKLAVMDNRDLWLSIWAQGIFRLRDGTWENMSADTLLSDHHYSHIISWKGANPIAATNHGIYFFDGESWAPFSAAGLSIYRVGGTLMESKDGSLWVNTTHTDWYYRGLKTEVYPEVKKKLFKVVQNIPDKEPPKAFIFGPANVAYSSSAFNIRWFGFDKWSRTPRDKLTYSHSVDGGPWSPFSTQTRLSRSDWSAGDHTLRVRVRDSDLNVGPNPVVHTFTLVLPVWRQGWAQVTAVLIVLVIFGLVTLVVRQRLRHLLELERIKLHFFTNISHELRTPLTLILGPVEKMLTEKTDSRNQSYLRTIQTNTSRLLHLIDQLLDFRRVEQGRLKSEPRSMDLVALIKNILETFDFVVKEKNQSLIFTTSFESCRVFLDEDWLYKIVDNLIHNSIKYTPPRGRVEIFLGFSGGELDPGMANKLRLRVEDNGQGVSPELRDYIFEPFYQCSQKAGKMKSGVGIGLALVKELVDLLGGEIKVESPVPGGLTGTRFTVDFPVKDPIIAYVTDEEPPLVVPPALEEELDSAEETRPHRHAHIHLVEDNPDVLQFLRSELSEDFDVSVSEDGLSAENAILETVPDLVITDVMMPKQDGYDLCKHLKCNPISSHVPVIMLTAFKTPHHEEEGLSLGADDYIAKPVSIHLLKLKIRNLLKRQERLREKIRMEYGLMPSPSSEIRPADRQFLDKAEKVAWDFLADEQFGVEQFAHAMGMSRSNFYKKFRDLTGMSPAAFVKLRRLNESARRIESGSGNVTEIAFDVGFSDVSYFSKCFKEQFGCPPSKYLDQQQSHGPVKPG